MIEKILSELDPNSYADMYKTIYSYDGIPVPRVGDIIKMCMYEQVIVDWSNHIGKRGMSNVVVLNDSAKKGTYVHNAIENYIQNGTILDVSELKYDHRAAVNNAWMAFLSWWEIMTKAGVEIIMQEQPLISKYYGGTLDIVIKVNNKKYLLDFKTSKYIYLKHFLQLSAYRKMLRDICGEEVDGVGIIRLSKEEPSFEECILDLSDEFNLNYMNSCEEAFLSMVYNYYNRLNVERGFQEVMRRHEMELNAV